MANTKTISCKDFLDKLESEDIQILDVRTSEEQAMINLKCKTYSIPLNEIKDNALNKLNTQPPTYILCHSGARAEKAALLLQDKGFAKPIVIKGGIMALDSANAPLNKKSGIPLERQVRIAAGALVLTGIGLGSLTHPGFYALSAFIGAGLIFSGLTGKCGMALMIAKAPWNTRKEA